MHRAAAIAAAIILAAAPALADPAARPALDFSETGQNSSEGDDTAFARSLAARYADSLAAAGIRADLAAQGFSCDAGGTYCTRAEMTGVCANGWSVYFNDGAPLTSRLTFQCMGAAEDDE